MSAPFATAIEIDSGERPANLTSINISQGWPPAVHQVVKEPVALTTADANTDPVYVITEGSIAEIARLKESGYVLTMDGFQKLRNRPMVYKWYSDRYPNEITPEMQSWALEQHREATKPLTPLRARRNSQVFDNKNAQDTTGAGAI